MGVPQTPAQNEMFPEGAQATSQYLAGIQGNFHLHKAVVDGALSHSDLHHLTQS